MHLNILDLAVYGILLVSIAAGFYKGLIATAANTAGAFASLFIAGWLYGGIALRVKLAGKLIPTLLYYSETSSMIGSVETARTGVSGMTQARLDSLFQNVRLPAPIGSWYTHNVLGAVYAGDGISTLGDYLSRTVAEAAVSIACFLAVFFIAYIALSLAVNLLHYIVKFPQLKYVDGVLGGAVGLLRGVLLAFVLFLLMPLALSMLPVQQVKGLVASSHTAGFFYQYDLLFGFIRSYIH
jgi:uncharacterized membrane protein required for colicin V production